MVRLPFKGSEAYGVTPSLPLLPGLLWFGVVVLVMVPFMIQIGVFKNYLVLHKNT